VTVTEAGRTEWQLRAQLHLITRLSGEGDGGAGESGSCLRGSDGLGGEGGGGGVFQQARYGDGDGLRRWEPPTSSALRRPNAQCSGTRTVHEQIASEHDAVAAHWRAVAVTTRRRPIQASKERARLRSFDA
jgi:hypothetical protein